MVVIDLPSQWPGIFFPIVKRDLFGFMFNDIGFTIFLLFFCYFSCRFTLYIKGGGEINKKTYVVYNIHFT